MRRRMRLRLLILVAALPLVLFAVLPMMAGGQTGRIASIQGKIKNKRDAIAGDRRRERVLASTIQSWSRKIGVLQSDITTLQARQTRIQADLDAKRAKLAGIQADLRSERARLARLRARLAKARVILARRLVDLYKADKPDVITVVLNADGFADLLQRSEFARRVSEQDTRIIRTVKEAKAEATRTAERLTKLEAEARRIAQAIQTRRDEVARVKGQLVDRRDQYASVRSKKSAVLSTVREHRHEMEGDLVVLEREQARISSALQQAASGNGYNPAVAGPPRAGSSGLIWPVNGPIVSPFGMRWGRLHAGVDIAAPAGTPIRAAASGTVVLMGWVGGYGNYTCIAHGGALSTCYAHQSSYATSQGASVSQGQIIGAVGCTGHCFGDHLHFETRINGSPVNPAGYL
jgi:murein DD-endopeptidase MepM/ murein hydrolase activator NlpD